MSWDVRETDAALADLEEALAYVSGELGSPRAAVGLLNSYEKVIGLLEAFPEGFPQVRDPLLSARGYRWAAVGTYVAFYTTDEPGHVVYIERILHHSRNWQDLLQG